MKKYLYRGVTKEMHEMQQGRLIPAGKNIKTVMQRNDNDLEGVHFKRDGRYTRDYSEQNTIRAHHMKSGMHDGAFISTTTNYNVACNFATNNGLVDGYVYVIDPGLFEKYDVTAKQDPDPMYEIESEVSIRSVDGGEISNKIIIKLDSIEKHEST